MGKLSGSLIYAAAWCGALIWIAAEAQTPSKLLGIDASGYGSYDPDVAVGAGLPSQSGQSGNCLTTTGTALSWGACGSGGAALSDNTPQPDGTATAGTDTEGSRSDHVHLLNPDIATNKATGASNKASITTIETQLGDVRGVPQPTNANSVGEVLTLTDTSVRSGNYEWKGLPEQNTAYKFFQQESLTVPDVSTNTQIPASGNGYRFTLLAEKEYTQGLKTGPFNTAYEGQINITLQRTQTAAIKLSTVHKFSGDKTLTTESTGRFRVNKQDVVTLHLVAFSSVTRLALGNITLDDGSVLNVTDEVLAAATKISINAEITLEEDGVRKAGQMTHLSGGDPKVTFWQLERVTGGGGGGDGSTTFIGLSDTPASYAAQGGKFLAVNSGATAVEFVDKPSGGGGASLSDKTPKPLGTAAAGSGTAASRDDHVHLVPAEIAGNTTQIAANNQSINRNHTSIATNTTGVATNKTAIATNTTGIATNKTAIATNTTGVSNLAADIRANVEDIVALEKIKNPALASTAAGHLVRQKSDHTVYETVAPATAVLAGLPAVAGHGGNVLTVNSAENGVEWKAGGGGDGGGGGGGLSITRIVNKTVSLGASSSDAGFISFTDTAFINSLKETGERGYSIRLSADSDAHSGTTASLETATFWVSGNLTGTRYLRWLPVAITNSGAQTNNFPSLQLDINSTRVELKADANWIWSGFQNLDVTVEVFKITSEGGGGGGGGDNPTIPKPTAAGANKFLRVNSAGAAYELAAVTGGHPFAMPGDLQPVKTGSNIGGTSTRVSRADHAHAIQTSLYGTPVAIGTANAAGSATTIARSDHVHSQGNKVATRDQLDAVQDQTDALSALTDDLTRGVHVDPGWTLVNSNGSEGGIAIASTWTLTTAKAASYSSARIDNPTGFAAVRVPVGADLRRYRLRIGGVVGTLFFGLNQIALLGTDATYRYVELGYALATGENVQLQISNRTIHETTFNGRLGPTPLAQVGAEGIVKIWQGSGLLRSDHLASGISMGVGLNQKIWAGMTGSSPKWRNLVLEIHWRDNSNQPVQTYWGRINFGTNMQGKSVSTSDRIRIDGAGLLNGSMLHGRIEMLSPNNFNSEQAKIYVTNCGFCNNVKMFTVSLVGVN